MRVALATNKGGAPCLLAPFKFIIAVTLGLLCVSRAASLWSTRAGTPSPPLTVRLVVPNCRRQVQTNGPSKGVTGKLNNFN